MLIYRVALNERKGKFIKSKFTKWCIKHHDTFLHFRKTFWDLGFAYSFVSFCTSPVKQKLALENSPSVRATVKSFV